MQILDITPYAVVAPAPTGVAATDTAALQALLDAIPTGGGTIVLQGVSVGTYKLNDELQIKKTNTRITCLGCALIEQTTTGKGVFKNATGTRLFTCVLENIQAQMSTGLTGGTAFDLLNMSDCTMRSVHALANPGEGFATCLRIYGNSAIGGSLRNNFFDCHFRSVGGAGTYAVLEDGDADTYGGNSSHFFGGSMRCDAGTAFRINRGDQNVLIGVTFEGTSAQAIDIEAPAGEIGGHLVQGCRFEGVTAGVVCKANNCRITGNSYSSGVAPKIDTTTLGDFCIVEEQSLGLYVKRSAVRAVGAGGFVAEAPSGTFAVSVNAANGDANPLIAFRANGELVMGAGGASAFDASLKRVASGVIAPNTGLFMANNKFVIGTSNTGPKLLANAGTPEASVSAQPGSLCVDSTNGEVYVKNTGSGNTGWKLITRAA